MSYLSLVLATASWGANFNLAKIVVRSLPPFTSAAIRFAVATLLTFAIYAAVETVDWRIVRGYLRWYVALGLFGIFGFNVLFFLGLKYTSAVNGSLIMATNPLMTGLLSSLVLHEPLRPRQRAGVLLSLLGIFFVITGGSWQVIRTMAVSIGDAMILLACACFAINGVLVRKYLSHRSPLSTTAISMLIGTALMVPFALVEPHPTALVAVPTRVWAALLCMAIPGSVLAYIFWNRGMVTLGPAKTSIFFNLVPVFTMLFSLLAGDRVTAPQIVGGAVVIAGCVVATAQRRSQAVS